MTGDTLYQTAEDVTPRRFDMTSEKILLEFQKIVKEEYDEDISLSEASEIMRNLVGYFDLLAKIHHRPLADQELKQNHERKK